MRRKLYTTTVAILAAATARVAVGQSVLPVYDPINYPSGPLAGNGGWNIGDPAPSEIAVDGSGNSDPATYTGLNPSATGAITMDNAAIKVTKLAIPNIADPTAGTQYLYYSMTLRVTNIDSLNASSTNGSFFAGFNNTSTGTGASVGGAFLRIRKVAGAVNPNTYELGICKDNGSSSPITTVWDTTDQFTVDETNASDNPTVMVVGRYDMSPGANNNAADMWVDPTASELGLSETSLASSGLLDTNAPNNGASGTDSNVADFFVRKTTGANTGTPQMGIDNIRVGTTWASVAPSVWEGTTSDYSNNSNWYTGAAPTGATMIPSFIDLSGASRTVNIGSGVTLGGMIFNSSTAYTITSNGGAALTLDSNDAAAPIQSSHGNHVISAPVVMNKNVTVDVEADSLTMSNTISSSGAGITVTGSGTGAFAMTGINSYTGPTVISTNGVLRAADGQGVTAGLSASNLQISGGELELTSSTPFTRPLGTGAGQVQLPSGNSGFSAFGAPVVINIGDGLGGSAQLQWGNSNFSPNALVLNDQLANNTVDFQNNIDLNTTGSRSISVMAGSATLSGVISNSAGQGGFTKNGPGILTLTNTNTYTGQTIVNNGVLRGVDGVNIPNNQSNSIIELTGGVYEPLAATFTRTLSNAATGDFWINGGTSGFSAYGQDLNVDLTVPNNTIQWATTYFTPTVLVLNSADATNNITLSNNLDLNTAATTVARTIQVNANTATITGTISVSNATGTASLIKTGAGTLQLGTGNTYNGGTQVNGGILGITDDTSVGANGTSITLNGGTLQYENDLSLDNARTILIGANGGTIDTNGHNEAGFGGTITLGTGSNGVFTKTGAGVFYTAGATGFTTLNINGGTYEAYNESQFLVAGSINFNGGALQMITPFTAGGAHNFNFSTTGTIDTSGQNINLSGSNFTGAGTMHKAGVGILTTTGIRTGGLSVDAGSISVAAGRSAAKLSDVGTISVASGSAMDLNDNDLILDYSGGASAAQSSAIQALIKRGYNNGAWNGDGLTSSQAKAQATSGHPTALGYSEASAVSSAIGGSFDGMPLDSDMVLVRYTYAGDANLNGTVDSSDFALLAANYNKTGQFWNAGDFNYDGTVNALDFNLLATNYGQVEAAALPDGAAPAALGALVPEPGSIALLASAGLLLGNRRRRRS